MKKKFHTIYLLGLSALFALGGFQLGARGQKMEIVVPAINKPVAKIPASQAVATVAVRPVVKTKNLPPVSVTPPEQPTVPAPVAVSTPTPTPAPTPVTAAS